MRRNVRKQRVVLRRKRRDHLKLHLRTVIIRSVLIALVIGFGIGIGANRDIGISRFVSEHTPDIDVQAPQDVPVEPVLAEFPVQKFWLWLPGSTSGIQKRLITKYPVVQSIRVEKNFSSKRVVVRIEPRKPIVIWRGSGVDREGMVFPIVAGAWSQLPQAELSTAVSLPAMGRWLEKVSSITTLWSNVSNVFVDSHGGLVLIMKTGTKVIWGTLEGEGLENKARTLVRILDDAHQHFSGAATTDLRFFDEGRIIVRPKSVQG